MLSKKMCLFYDSMIIGKATFIPSIILRSLIFNELTTNHDSIKVVFTKEICIETKGYLPSRAKTDIFIQDIFKIVIDLASCIRLDIIPVCTAIRSDNPIKSIMPFHDNVPIQRSRSFFSMNSCFHTSPIIPKCNIGSIQYFGLRTRETFRKQSTDTFMLPENSSQNRDINNLRRIRQIIHNTCRPKQNTGTFIALSEQNTFLFFRIRIIDISSFGR